MANIPEEEGSGSPLELVVAIAIAFHAETEGIPKAQVGASAFRIHGYL